MIEQAAPAPKVSPIITDRSAPGDVVYLTVNDIAHQLKYSAETVREYIKKGDLIAQKYGREYRIHPANYDRFLQGFGH